MDAESHGVVNHKTSSGLQIIDINGDGRLKKVLVDSNTRTTFLMDDTQWRELETYIMAVLSAKNDIVV